MRAVVVVKGLLTVDTMTHEMFGVQCRIKGN